MTAVEHYFTPSLSKANQSDKIARLISLQIKFSLISVLFAIGYFVMSYFNGFLMARYLMVISSIVFLLQLIAFKYQVVSLRFTSHVFVLFCWLIVFVLSLASGGIQSYVLPWISLIPIMGLVLLSKRAAFLWSGMGFFTVIFFIQIDASQYIPTGLLMTGNTLLTASLHIGLQFIILTLTYIFDRQQNSLIQKIEQQNKILVSSQGAMMAQHETLVQNQIELAHQRDKVSEQNVKLEEARKIIESQHQILLEKNEGLESEIKKRTKELVEYNQQLEQFAFMSSHNLRAPIARILGLGNLLELTTHAEDENKIKTNLIGSARELDRIVKDLSTILDLRKNSITSVQDIDLEKEFHLITLNLEKEISETNTSIAIDFTAAPTIRTVRPYLDSILINLIGNAIKYRHPNRRPEIEVLSEMRGNHFFLMVKDNGIGLDLNQHGHKVFTIYSRFHSHVEGKGLGLYLVKTQCEALGGKVEIISSPEKGTTFTISLLPSP